MFGRPEISSSSSLASKNLILSCGISSWNPSKKALICGMISSLILARDILCIKSSLFYSVTLIVLPLGTKSMVSSAPNFSLSYENVN